MENEKKVMDVKDFINQSISNMKKNNKEIKFYDADNEKDANWLKNRRFSNDRVQQSSK